LIGSFPEKVIEKTTEAAENHIDGYPNDIRKRNVSI
jgi:hypothetical protein